MYAKVCYHRYLIFCIQIIGFMEYSGFFPPRGSRLIQSPLKFINMTPVNILQADTLDLLFENRNKGYGAYLLRRDYPNRMRYALSGMLGLCVIFAILSAFNRSPSVNSTWYSMPDGPQFAPPPPADKKADPPVKPRVKPVSTARFLSTIQISKQPDLADTLVDVSDFKIGSHLIITSNPGIDFVKPLESGISTGEPAPQLNSVAVPTDNPDIQPSFPGGEAALRQYLADHLRAPAELNEDESVLVKVRFVIGYDGSLSHFDVVEDGGRAFTQEVIRVIKNMPEWTPGKKGGNAVPVYYTLPVRFAATN